MDTSKIIKGAVSSGRYTVTAPIVKEDYGLYLQIEGVELPSTYEVDFSNSEHSGTSVTMIGNSDGVLIPHQFIETGKDVFAFLYHVGADYGRTVYKFRIPNKCRPDRTNEEPTPEEQSVIDQAINALNEAVAQTAQDVIDADASAQASAESAQDSASSALSASDSAERASASATSASNSASSASASATASANSASQSAQIKTDVQGLVSNAQGYASASAQSATASANSASQASGYATSASQSATSAQGYAQTAESAKTASQTAQGLAESARDSAISAKTDAESARDEAQSAVASISGALAEKAPIITDTASGSIASFSDGADNLPLKSLVVDINPVQDLHGQDAPYPAGGGKNLFNWNRTEGTPNPTTASPLTSPRVMDTEHYFVGVARNNYYGRPNIQSYSVADGVISVTTRSSGYGLGFPVEIEENTDYVVSYVNVNNGKVSVGYYDEDWNYLDNKDIYSAPYTFNAPVSSKYAVFVVTPQAIVAGQDNECTVKDVQVELGTTATSYAPYENLCPISGWTEVNVNHSDADMTNPTTLTIQLGQTVYGGKLDVLSGILTVYPYYDSYNGETLTGEWISDRDKYVAGTTPTIGAQVVNIGAEGTEIQLEPHEIASLLGANNIFADTGDCTVEYRADTKLYIAKKIAEAISALS